MKESRARKEIVHYCRMLWDRRLVTGSSGNVSLRIGGGRFLVTPAGRSLRALAPEEIVLVDASGTSRDGTATSEIPLHLACYAARADVDAIVHTHPRFCVVWSRTGRLFPQDTVGARETLGHVAWSAYHPPGSAELAAEVSASARDRDTILMERHGLTALGSCLEDAFLRSDLAEEAAAIGVYGHFLARE